MAHAVGAIFRSAKMSVMNCVECNKPGKLKEHPECEKARRARRERDRKSRLKEQGVTSSDRARAGRAKRYGITVPELLDLAAKPCDVCGDHDRNSPYERKDTGTVAGTVCQKCATALGFFGHDPKRLRAALSLLTT
ncbi:primase-helicase zinc-binding domain-containing protein [Streptomyces sp. NPDC094144]|uniref:primase-helicase zinc-binding domain-containing protein n=1 Tax=Streptomyces sp. NPDC094144 TaxID=3366056 RepID=UPI0038096A54